MEHGLLRPSKFGLSCADVRARWGRGPGGVGFGVSPASRSFKVAHKLERFWAVQCLIILGTVKTSAPKSQTAPDLFFSYRLPSPTPFCFLLFLSLFLSFSFSLLFPPFQLGGVLSKFKLPSELGELESVY